MTDAAADTASYREFDEGFGLSALGMTRYWTLYLDGAPTRSSRTPRRCAPRDLAGLPPAIVITAAADVLRDEGEAYADALQAAGVPVSRRRYPAIHGFWRWLAAAELSREAVASVGAELRAALA